MAKFEVQGRVSYSALMGIYSGDSEIDLEAISEGKKLEKILIEMIRSKNIPPHLQGVVTERFRHNKTDVGRVTLEGENGDSFGVEVLIKPDFVFDIGNVIDVKLGGPEPSHVIQATMVSRVMMEKYRYCPNYYLLTDRLMNLHWVNLQDGVTNRAFDKFVISCVARAGLQVRREGFGGMFEGNEVVGWEALLGSDEAILDLMHDSLMQIGVSVLGLCV